MIRFGLIAALRRGLSPTRSSGGPPRPIMRDMNRAPEVILADALRLGPDARAQLAAELLASLDGPSGPDAEVV